MAAMWKMDYKVGMSSRNTNYIGYFKQVGFSKGAWLCRNQEKEKDNGRI